MGRLASGPLGGFALAILLDAVRLLARLPGLVQGGHGAGEQVPDPNSLLRVDRLPVHNSARQGFALHRGARCCRQSAASASDSSVTSVPRSAAKAITRSRKRRASVERPSTPSRMVEPFEVAARFLADTATGRRRFGFFEATGGERVWVSDMRRKSSFVVLSLSYSRSPLQKMQDAQRITVDITMDCERTASARTCDCVSRGLLIAR